MSMFTTPESIISFYALNKIGAVINMTNVLSGLDNFKDQINLTKSKLIILHDLTCTYLPLDIRVFHPLNIEYLDLHL